MDQKMIIGIVAVVIVVGIAGYFLMSGGGNVNTGTQTTTAPTQSAETQTTPTEVTAPATSGGGTTPSEQIGVGATASATTTKEIDMTANGFTPNTITTNKGDTINFVNKDSAQHWPASAVHPTHTLYPEPGGCIGSKFDACKGLAQGESWSFIFNQVGSWKYHDHLSPASTGTITVQ